MVNQRLRRFKQRKRLEYRDLAAAINCFFKGSGYLPPGASLEFGKARQHLLKMYEQLKPWWSKA